MRASLGWIPQIVGIAIVGAALLVGLIHDALPAEVALPTAGCGLFLPGRRLGRNA